MFDVTQDNIAQLDDVDLRELVARLCEAELASRGLSPAAVTWGGNQTAADGGLDVRVALPQGSLIDGFIPRYSTGFQVKASDMPRAEILAEMQPRKVIRPVIQELADERGAYIIVSSQGSTTDLALRNRQKAMHEALTGVDSAAQIHTDFYDRTRLATWVRQHPGLIIWVRAKIGRALLGWRPYGAWSGAVEGISDQYLLDEKRRLSLGESRGKPAQSVVNAIDELRDRLSQPGKVVRLVGLSGVGKTRLVQALFDARIGSRPLPPSLAVYTNLSDNPDPQPTGLVSDLIANRTRAILIVDNCPPELHRRLAELCSASESTASLLTVEYDVRDDQPEGTQIVTLETSSLELIEALVQRRFAHLSGVDVRTIAEASGGNARIAIAIAGTVQLSESVADLSDEELFQRLFRQRQDPDNALLHAAQACSLVYSFQGESIEGGDTELSKLAALVDQNPKELYRHVAELLRRDLVQQRGVWRAMLPHAIANRLAARALEDIPIDLIERQLVTHGSDRLARSFSRRLAFLHEHAGALRIVERWFARGGLLGDPTALNEVGQAMFENVAPVLPSAALSALEWVASCASGAASTVLSRHQSLLRSLAYDASLFDKSAGLLSLAATENSDEKTAEEVSNTFTSLFTIYLSGTHANIEQRLSLTERLLRSNRSAQRALGLASLEKVLKTSHFSSHRRFEFGARPRDYGYQPQRNEEVTIWYAAALALIERLALNEGLLLLEMKGLVARHFRGLWRHARTFDQLEGLVRRFAADGFWREGWVACRQILRFDRKAMPAEISARISSLETELRPRSISERVRAVVLVATAGVPMWDDVALDDDIASNLEKAEAIATELGATVAEDEVVLSGLLPDLLQGGARVWAFGRGLASAAKDKQATWSTLVAGLELLPPAQRSVEMLRGYLSRLWEQDKDLADKILESALDHPVLVGLVPLLQSAIELDARGVRRMKQVLHSGNALARQFKNLALGGPTSQLASSQLKELILLIAEQPDGFDVALEILARRFFSDRSAGRIHEPELLEAGRVMLGRTEFKRRNEYDAHQLAVIASTCLAGPEAAPWAAKFAIQMKQAIDAYKMYAFENGELVGALLKVQPIAVLDAIFDGDESARKKGIGVFDHLRDFDSNPADEVSSEDLLAWCKQSPGNRFSIAASIVTFARQSEEGGHIVWSEQAQMLLANAPDPESVITVFVERFRPTTYGGSRASVMEANLRLFDSLEESVAKKLASTAATLKAEFAREIEEERRHETASDRTRDERFE